MPPTVLLPSHTRPVRYAVSLKPDLVACTFTGHETIDVEILEGTQTLTVHCYQLVIDGDVSFLPSGDSSDAVRCESITYDDAAQTASFAFASSLLPGKGRLRISAFTGKLNDELAGFYRSKYTVRGEDRWQAVTQFEATDARRCFPCWDEPACKAVFSVTVTAPADRCVLSNAHAIRVETSPDGRERTHVFGDSPMMSTYLVAVVVGEFDTVSAVGGRGIVTSVHCPPGKAALGEFALGVGVRSLALLEELFRVPYAMAKADHVAIASFAAGAMENYGCITYREAALLIDEASSSFATKQRVAQVVAHELSHQWFGNYTTMQWWDGLWLNEGFAKNMEYMITSRLFPAWRTFDHFTAMVQAAAFGLDALQSTHPIQVPVNHPDEINEIFDAISYNKGASVIRMVFDWLGEEAAFAGLHTYLTRHAFGNTVTDHLWEAWEQASGLPVKATMQAWVLKPGYPLVYIADESTPGGSDDAAVSSKALRLESRRYIAPWAANDASWPSESDYAGGPSPAAAAAAATAWKPAVPAAGETDDWCIPISAVLGSGETVASTTKLGVMLLDPGAAASGTRDEKLAAMAASIRTAAGTAGAQWVKLNSGTTAFFRTLYSPTLLARLLPAVTTPAGGSSSPALSVSDRLGLVGDVAAGVSIGHSSAVDLLRLLWALRRDPDYNVWVAMLDALEGVVSAAEGTGAGLPDALASFKRALLQPVVAAVGWEARPGEEPNAPLLRAMVLRSAAMAGDAGVVSECLRRFDAYASAALAAGTGGTVPADASIPADLRALVYNTAAAEAQGGEERWASLRSLLAASTLSEEQRRLMTALGRSAHPSLLQRALDMALAGEEVRSQDAVFLVGAVASNPGPTGRTLAWRWLRDGWAELYAKMGHANFLWGGVVGACVGGFSSREAFEEISAFFADASAHPTGSATRKVRQSLEAIRGRVWRAHILRAEEAAVAEAARALVAGSA